MNVHETPRRWPCAIDMHAHLMIPEMYAVTAAHSMFVKSNADPGMNEAARKVVREREAFVGLAHVRRDRAHRPDGRHGRRRAGALLEPRAPVHLLGGAAGEPASSNACSTSAWPKWSRPIRAA